MKKNVSRKLSFKKETLVNLHAGRMSELQGGIKPTYQTYCSCRYTHCEGQCQNTVHPFCWTLPDCSG